MARKKFHCKSKAQAKAIKANYARRAVQNKQQQLSPAPLQPKPAEVPKKQFPDKFPFWARLKINKKRTTLVIDEEQFLDRRTKKIEEGFVHREATHTKKDKEYEEVNPNPDKDDPEPMYLKRPRKHPKRMFEPHNKDLAMPDFLKERYEKNNHKGENDGKDKKE